MIYTNTPNLRKSLFADGLLELSAKDSFEFQDAVYEKHYGNSVQTHPKDTEQEWADRAAFRCLTHGIRPVPWLPTPIPSQQTQLSDQSLPVLKDISSGLSALRGDLDGFRREWNALADKRRRNFRSGVALLGIVIALVVGGVFAFGQQQPTLPAYIVAACGDALPAGVNTEGGRGPVVRDTTGKLCVAITGAAGGTSAADNSVFTGGTTSVTPIGAIYDASPPTITDGRVGAPRMDSDRNLHVNCITGCAAAGDVTGSTVALNVLDETAQVDLAGENGANVFLAAGTLDGTLTPEVSYDDGTTWAAAVFINGLTGAVTTSQAFTNPNAATALIIGYIGPVTQARVRLSAVTGGTASATLRATVTRPYVVMYGSDGTNIRQLKTDTGGAAQVDVESSALPTGASTAAKQPALGTAGTASTDVITVQGVASMTPLLATVSDGAGALNVIVDSGTITAVTAISNALPAGNNNIGDVDVATFNGVTPLMGAGNTGTGSPRVTISTDQAALVGLAIYTEDAGETAGGNLSMAGTVRRDTPASSAGTTGDNATLNTNSTGALWVAQEPTRASCADETQVNSVVISTATSGNVELVAISGGTTVYACGFSVIAGGTVGVQFISGTGTACATGETNKTGVYPLIVNSGIAVSNGGAMQFKSAAGEALCVELSAAVQIDGLLTFVQR